jgi:deazaflavin-dependent oxidoreductase (nitroreductase family)
VTTTQANRYQSFNEDLIADLRANRGQATSGPFVGKPVLILTHKGARTGDLRESPLAYTRAGDDYVVIASKGGAPTNPQWYHNLVANPDAKLEVDGDDFRVRAREAKGEERDRLYAAQVEVLPGFADYEKKTTRKIPVFVLEPID